MTLRRVGMAGLLTVMMCGGAVLAQEKKDPKPEAGKAGKGLPETGKPGEGGMTPEQMAEMEAWMKAGTPGPEHKNLDYMVGKWDVTVKHWMSPGMDPEVSTGTSDSKWIFGGRQVHYDFKGNMMNMPFEGGGTTGYDNIKKQYYTTWTDTMSTGLMISHGTYDAAKKTFTFLGEFTDPMGKNFKSRELVKVISNDEHVLEFFHAGPDGKEMKVMELTYKRVGKAAAPAAPATK